MKKLFSFGKFAFFKTVGKYKKPFCFNRKSFFGKLVQIYLFSFLNLESLLGN